MACTPNSKKSFLAHTAGTVGAEQIMVVLTVGLLGIAGFTLLGDGMRTDIRGAGHGDAATSRGAMVTAQQAGQGPTQVTPTTLYVDPTAPVGPSAASKAAAVASKAIKEALKAQRADEGFFGRLTRAAGDVVQGIVGLPGNIADGILPGHGFLGEDGFFTKLGAGFNVGKNWIADLIGFNTARARIAQFKKNGLLETYNRSLLESWTSWARLDRLDSVIGRLANGLPVTPEEYRAALLTLDAIAAETASVDLNGIAKSLEKKNAILAADAFTTLAQTLQGRKDAVASYRRRLAKFAAPPGVDAANTAVSASLVAVANAKALLNTAEFLETSIPKATAAAVRNELERAKLTLQQEWNGVNNAVLDQLSAVTKAIASLDAKAER